MEMATTVGGSGGMDIASLKRQLASMPENEREAFLAALIEDYGGRGDTRDAQRDYASELRGTAMPGMREAGGFSVAANPLEFLGSLGQRGVGMAETNRIDKEADAASKRKEEALRVLQQLAMARGGGMPGMAPGMSPAMGGGNPYAAMLRAGGPTSMPGM